MWEHLSETDDRDWLLNIKNVRDIPSRHLAQEKTKRLPASRSVGVSIDRCPPISLDGREPNGVSRCPPPTDPVLARLIEFAGI